MTGYRSDFTPEERAAYNARRKELRDAKRAGEPPKPPRAKPRRMSDTHPDRIVCAAEGCTKLLTVAAVAGGSEHCSRGCAGIPVTETAWTGLHSEREPTARDLAEVGAS